MADTINRNVATIAANTANKIAIQTEKLSKSYGASRGISELDLEVQTGEVFGFLGPNGAGKTTTIRILLDLIRPTGGSAAIFGQDCQKESVAIRQSVGYLPGEFSLYGNLNGAQNLQYLANLRGGVDWKYVQNLAQRLDLDLSKKFKQYSRGNKQKMGIIQAVMHQPKLLILDEPTGGLDPLNQQEFYKLVGEVQATGTTVFFSSHIISEVERVCDRVAIIREGKLVKIGHISELLDVKSHLLEITFSSEPPLAEFQALEGISQVEIAANNTLHCVARAETLDKVLKLVSHYPVVNFVSREPSLEETFLEYYQKQEV